MPAIHYTLRWPDGRETVCYSPSLVVQELLQTGRPYPLPEFLRLIREATAIASERVRAKYGYACSMAHDQLAAIESLAAAHHDQPGACVQVLGFDPS